MMVLEKNLVRTGTSASRVQFPHTDHTPPGRGVQSLCCNGFAPLSHLPAKTPCGGLPPPFPTSPSPQGDPEGEVGNGSGEPAGRRGGKPSGHPSPSPRVPRR